MREQMAFVQIVENVGRAWSCRSVPSPAIRAPAAESRSRPGNRRVASGRRSKICAVKYAKIVSRSAGISGRHAIALAVSVQHEGQTRLPSHRSVDISVRLRRDAHCRQPSLRDGGGLIECELEVVPIDRCPRSRSRSGERNSPAGRAGSRRATSARRDLCDGVGNQRVERVLCIHFLIVVEHDSRRHRQQAEQLAEETARESGTSCWYSGVSRAVRPVLCERTAGSPLPGSRRTSRGRRRPHRPDTRCRDPAFSSHGRDQRRLARARRPTTQTPGLVPSPIELNEQPLAAHGSVQPWTRELGKRRRISGTRAAPVDVPSRSPGLCRPPT